jgi:hypothetical protein
VTAADVVLLAGYVLAVPFTLFVPGFKRLWNRREPWAYAGAQGGALLIVVGWLLRDRPLSAAVNALWLLGFGAAYAWAGMTAHASVE